MRTSKTNAISYLLLQQHYVLQATKLQCVFLAENKSSKLDFGAIFVPAIIAINSMRMSHRMLSCAIASAYKVQSVATET